MRRLATGLVPRLLTWTGVRPAWQALRHRVGEPFVTGVNYHWTARESAGRLEAQFDWFAERFTVLDRAGLAGFFAGTAGLDRPGLVICFDDGNRNTFEVAAPLLEARGLRGWWFLIAGTLDPAFPDTVPGMPRKFLLRREEARELVARGHVVGSHAYAHEHLGAMTGERLEREVVGSKTLLEEVLGAPVDAFCYPFGTSDSFSAASQALVARTYRFGFNSCPRALAPTDSPHAIGRHHLAPEMSPHLVRLKASGLLDLRHRRRTRRFLEAATGTPGRAVGSPPGPPPCAPGSSSESSRETSS